MNELVIFWSTLQWQPNFFWAKSTVQYSPCSLHAILLVGAASIRQKGQYCYAGHIQINYLTRWTQENQLTDHTHTHTHTYNGPLSGTIRVSRYQKGKTNLDFTEARDSEWQWHQLGHMQACTSLQTDNHASTPPLSFLQAGCPSCRPTNSVKALKA